MCFTMFWSYSSSSSVGKLSQVEELCSERVVEMVDIVLVQPFQLLVTQMLGQFIEALHIEKR